MSNPAKLPINKVEPFTIEVSAPTTTEDIRQFLAPEFSCAILPDKSEFLIPLLDAFAVHVDPEAPSVLCFEPNREGIDSHAVRWCQALTLLPPKSLPRSQRPIIKLLKRLPENPTGIPTVDSGRRRILDQTIKSLWPAMLTALSASLASSVSDPPTP